MTEFSLQGVPDGDRLTCTKVKETSKHTVQLKGFDMCQIAQTWQKNVGSLTTSTDEGQGSAEKKQKGARRAVGKFLGYMMG